MQKFVLKAISWILYPALLMYISCYIYNGRNVIFNCVF